MQEEDLRDYKLVEAFSFLIFVSVTLLKWGCILISTQEDFFFLFVFLNTLRDSGFICTGLFCSIQGLCQNGRIPYQ